VLAGEFDSALVIRVGFRLARIYLGLGC
jgi:hypothetical protein